MDINRLHSQACGGDQKAQKELFEVLSSRFRLFTHHKIRNKSDAEEITQEALMTIYAEYDKIEVRVSFSAWAYKVLDNRILNYFRKKKRENQRIDEEISQNPESIQAVARTDPDLKRRLLDCLKKICRRNLRYARILNLHYLGYKTGEVCEKLKAKPETLYSALSKARSMLINCLEKGDVKK